MAGQGPACLSQCTPTRRDELEDEGGHDDVEGAVLERQPVGLALGKRDAPALFGRE